MNNTKLLLLKNYKIQTGWGGRLKPSPPTKSKQDGVVGETWVSLQGWGAGQPAGFPAS